MPSFSTYCIYLLSVLSAEAHGPHHPRGGHRHHRATDSATKLTQDEQLLHDKEHIREDLKEVVPNDITSKMTPEELEFYYFKIHDSDNNSKLDGLEILQAIQHTSHDGGTNDEDNKPPEEPEDFDRIVGLIDRVLAEDDLDQDGFLSYIEYVKGRNRDTKHKSSNT